MLNHGVSTGALFLLFGFLYERRHARLMSDYGGIAKVMPIYTAFFVIVTFSSIAVPGTNGFVGEFLVLLGSFKSNLPMWFSVASTTAVILGAGYMLLMVQKVFFGQLTHPENLALKDLNGRELTAAIPLVLLIALMGLKPQPILDLLNASTSKYVARAAYASGAANVNDEDQQVRVMVRQLPVTPAVAEADRAPALLPSPTVAQLRAHGIPGGLLRPALPPSTP
jgi:NADH-quinone oxidoreductase subunit M